MCNALAKYRTPISQILLHLRSNISRVCIELSQRFLSLKCILNLLY